MSVTDDPLFVPLRLQSGQVLTNRVAKAAMEENLAGEGQLPDERLFALYRAWAAGGSGLVITGNVMIEGRAMTGPAGVVLEARSPLEPFEAWARAGKGEANRLWMQVNHPGRQVKDDLGGISVSPSGIGIGAPYAEPRVLDEAGFDGIVDQFVTTSRRAIEAGFDGVQVHGAHGYLLNQFLSPIVNTRTDAWGGPLANRARLLLTVVQAVRSALGDRTAIGLKLNTADFQRGGFGPHDALGVVRLLADSGIDLLELSGGSAEVPAMHGATVDGSTASREAYFLDASRAIVADAAMPVMLTGGIRTAATARRVLESGVSVAGIGTALAVMPDLPLAWQRGEEPDVSLARIASDDKATIAAAKQATVRYLMRHPSPPTGIDPLTALELDSERRTRYLARYRHWLATREIDVAPIS
jgi:2,4-dienoyl-CoA reductase-like NADH-dependent reductase (Old Yellow Enzyme family)